ncbi:hypothetical protein [Streptomyces afghaniensis]|uniref:hypothetical protein n=1 Tax=Streptomyces afghaniensis TaxID=66865 RepID=UPI0027813105|nr:hypothetical protein [Streptomyces afghaniensis]MDQ1016583.1 hypothetical protein [Streptomyces afghaniensis]
MSSDTFVIDPSARMPDADIWFALPAGFVPVPLTDLVAAEEAPTSAEGQRYSLEALAAMWTGPEHSRQLPELLAPVRRLAHVLAYSGVIHCSVGMHRDDEGDGSLLLSLFTLGWRETSWAPRGVMAGRAAAGMADASHVEALDLPCGPATLVESRTSPQVADETQELLQVIVYVPFPDARKLAILTLSTVAVHRSGHYRDLLRETARMVTFDNPFPMDHGEA